MEDLTATVPDAELAKLEAMAIEHDTQATADSANTPEVAQPVADTDKPANEANPDNSETDTDNTVDRPRDELGRFTKTETGEDIPEDERQPAEQQTEPKPVEESEYAKAKKKREREESLLRGFEEKRQQFQREQEQFQREREEWQRQQAEAAHRRTGEQKPEANKIADLAKRAALKARELRAQGDYEKADEYADFASEQVERLIEAQQQEQEQAATQAQQIEEYHRNLWAQTMERVVQANADDFKTPDAPIAKAVNSLLSPNNKFVELFEKHPLGFEAATEVAKIMVQAASVSELREKLTKAEAEVQRLSKATSPIGAGPTTPIQAKQFDSLSTDEQLKALERMAASHDALAVA